MRLQPTHANPWLIAGGCLAPVLVLAYLVFQIQTGCQAAGRGNEISRPTVSAPPELAQTPPARLPHVPNIGDVLVTGNNVFGAESQDAYKRMVRLAVAHDKEGLIEMAGVNAIVLIEPGTQVRVIDYGGMFDGSLEVRVLGGDYYGSSVWLGEEDIH